MKPIPLPDMAELPALVRALAKTSAPNLRAIAARINTVAAADIRKNFLPPQTVATVQADDDTGAETLCLQIERWRENARTLTNLGRAEISSEEKAVENLLDLAAQFGRVVLDGDGSGEYGPIKSWRVET